MSKSLNIIVTSLASFAAGFAVGLLVAPQSGRENRKWVEDHTKEAKHWVEEKGHHILEESEKRLEKISEGIKESIPDLYEATESIHLDESDIEDAT